MPFGPTVPWAPEALPINRHEVDQWTYVVLEEVVDEIALLRWWPWPTVDRLGRLVWTGGTEHDTDAIAVDLELVKAQLYTANGLQREPRCGDTFAIQRVAGHHSRSRRLHDLRDVFGTGKLYDISADAREAAKIAYQSSVGAIQRAPEVDPVAKEAVAAELQRRKRPGRLRPLYLGAPLIPVATRGAGR
jgi:hypothetical protein